MATERLWCQNGKHFWERKLRRGPKPRSCKMHAPLMSMPALKRPALKRDAPRKDLTHLWSAYLVAWEAWMHANDDPFMETRERLVAKELADALLEELLDAADPAIRDRLLARAQSGRQVPFGPTS